MPYSYTDASKSMVTDGLGKYIPTDPANTDWADLVKRKVRIGNFQEPPRFANFEAAHAAMVSWIDTYTSNLSGNVPLQEQLGWAAKEDAARAVVAGTATQAQVAMIATEAGITGEDHQALAARVVAKSERFRSIVATISGLRRKTEEALAAVTDPRDYEAVLMAARVQAEQLAEV